VHRPGRADFTQAKYRKSPWLCLYNYTPVELSKAMPLTQTLLVLKVFVIYEILSPWQETRNLCEHLFREQLRHYKILYSKAVRIVYLYICVIQNLL
jgi:hypothetical protein